ncbi:hypothetical protein [Paraburkholderia kururiensis]|uniref:Uncharacterized protein n=1 Tax=Paraburkholderia kururiensis TaxID=984307 RepID=A0ABZ0WU49_9BURK|nr:hypothetical protein [Paraburkholderia kururiensis]WQD80731.1 hypothetical protein U0042_14185 [Paraburkholderia kururiensis]
MLACVLCSACAAGGSSQSSGGESGITMYGTIDEGISYHSK